MNNNSQQILLKTKLQQKYNFSKQNFYLVVRTISQWQELLFEATILNADLQGKPLPLEEWHITILP